MDTLVQENLKCLNDLCLNQELCEEVDEILFNLETLSSERKMDEIETVALEFEGFVEKLNKIENCFVFVMLRGDDGSFHIVANPRSCFLNESQIRSFKENVSGRGINYQFSLDRFGWNWCNGEPLVAYWHKE